MEFQQLLSSFGALHSQFGGLLDTWMLIFARILSFLYFAPVFNRKDIPFLIKVTLAVYLTCILFWVLPSTAASLHGHGSYLDSDPARYLLRVVLNIFIGGLIGFIGDMVLQAAYSAGDVMNNQIGLSSAMAFDPSQRKQVALFGTLFTFITTIAYIEAGGMYWLIDDLKRSFEVFPLEAITFSLQQKINMGYLVTVSGNTLLVAVELVAPVIVVTLAVDLLLGIINRTAQQIPVFQLSFALKPTIGVLVMMATLPLFLETLMHFLHDFNRIF